MQILEIIRWVASGTGMIAAVLVALNAGARITGIGFVIFTGSSICWIATAVWDGNMPLAAQNGVLFAINLFGVYRYLYRKVKEEKAEEAAGETERSVATTAGA